MKPRWVGVKGSVLIPHRRAFFGRWYVWMVTRKASATAPDPTIHAPPDPSSGPANEPSSPPSHDARKMLLWRLAAVLAYAVIAGHLTGDGEAVTTIGLSV